MSMVIYIKIKGRFNIFQKLSPSCLNSLSNERENSGIINRAMGILLTKAENLISKSGTIPEGHYFSFNTYLLKSAMWPALCQAQRIQK